MTAFLTGVAIGVCAFALFASWVASRSKVPDGLPCPHPHCKNRLPRRGTLLLPDSKYCTEKCAICDGVVLFVPWSPGIGSIDNRDTYVRVHVPEVKS